MKRKSTTSAGPAGRGLSHLDPQGRARMVDVGDKPATRRRAVAAGTITMNATAFAAVRDGTLAKGEIGPLARIAGIAAAKRTSDLIPLCHPVPIDHVAVDVRLDEPERAVHVEARVGTRWSTGVEMEALTAVSAALLTIYDVAKAIDRGMQIDAVRLLHKSGGRSGTYDRMGRSRQRAR